MNTEWTAETIGVRLVCLVIGYCFGPFQTAYIIGRANGIDIREKGSGNAGTTNTLRVLGKKAGLIVLLADLLKGILAVNIVYFIFRAQYPALIYLLKLYTGFGVILGHNYPFYLQFKGGKGIAAMGGMILAFHWVYIPINLLLFFGTVALTHYVSFASLLLAACFLVQTILFGEIGLFRPYLDPAHTLMVPVIPNSIRLEMYLVALIITVMAFVRHHENIRKLLKGEERKTYVFKKNKKENTDSSTV